MPNSSPISDKFDALLRADQFVYSYELVTWDKTQEKAGQVVVPAAEPVEQKPVGKRGKWEAVRV